MLKVVIDTSVFIAAILSPSSNSSPRKILRLWRQGRFTVVVAPPLLEELITGLIRRGVSVGDVDLDNLLLDFRSIALHIPGVYEATRLDEVDPDDNKFLAAAYEAKADYLVSVDKHLLGASHRKQKYFFLSHTSNLKHLLPPA